MQSHIRINGKEITNPLARKLIVPFILLTLLVIVILVILLLTVIGIGIGLALAIGIPLAIVASWRGSRALQRKRDIEEESEKDYRIISSTPITPDEPSRSLPSGIQTGDTISQIVEHRSDIAGGDEENKKDDDD